MTFTPKNNHERIQHRLKISQGHLKKVISMIEKDAYCIDTLHQIQAVQEGLKGAANLILENHLKNCAADAIRKGKSNEAINEIMKVLDKKPI